MTPQIDSSVATSCTRPPAPLHGCLLTLGPVKLLERNLIHQQQVAEVVGQSCGAVENAIDQRVEGRVVGGSLRQRLDDRGREVLGRRDRSGRGRWSGRRRVHGTRRWLKLQRVELLG